MDRDNRDDRKRPHPGGDSSRPKAHRPENGGGDRRGRDRDRHRDPDRDPSRSTDRNRDRQQPAPIPTDRDSSRSTDRNREREHPVPTLTDRDRSRTVAPRESFGSPHSSSSSQSQSSSRGNDRNGNGTGTVNPFQPLSGSINGYQGRGRGGHHGSGVRRPPTGDQEQVQIQPNASNVELGSSSGDRGRGGRGGLQSRLVNMAAESSVNLNDPSQAEGGRGGGRGRGRGRGRGGARGRRERPTDAQLANFVNSRPTDPKTNEPKVKRSEPGQNESTPINLVANYYPLLNRINWTLYNYHVDFIPVIENTFEKRCLFRPHQASIGWHIFNGDAIFTSSALEPNQLIFYSDCERIQGKVQIKINPDFTVVQPTDEVNIQIYNILIRDCMRRLNLEQMGRHYYNQAVKTSFHAENLEIWPGYKTSLRQHEDSLLLCVEMTNKVFQLQKVNLYIRELQMRSRNSSRDEIKNELLGCVVMTTYNRKTYRVDDINWEETPAKTFDCRGNEVTLAQYMMTRYQIQVTDMTQPILYSRASRQEIRRGLTEHIALIPEFCLLTGLRDHQRKNFGLMRKLNEVLQLNPTNRVRQIRNFANILAQNRVREEVLQRAGLDLGQDLVRVQGKVLTAETIFFGLNGSETKMHNPITNSGDRNHYDWSLDLLRSPMADTTTRVRHWIVIYAQGQPSVQEFVRIFVQQANGMNFKIFPDPAYVEVSNSRDVRSFLDAIDSEMRSKKSSLQLIMIILPDNKETLYGEIKRSCFQQWGIPSQCVLSKNVVPSNKQRGVAGKLAIQVNAKLGGVPWRVKIPIKGLMTIGYSMSTTARGKSGARGASVGALVAATNDDQTKYYSTLVDIDQSQNISSILGVKFAACLRAYKRINDDKLPTRIIFYRDGVGDGQLHVVYNTEVAEIKKAYRDVYASAEQQEPKFGFIVVSKRVNTKFFQPSGPSQTYSNPGPGTVVDDVVTLSERYDFYLISAKGTGQGTVSPTSYNVLCDEMSLKPFHVQLLTFKLCHLYFNWNSTVSVPAVCQYAHKLAFVQNIINKSGRGGRDGNSDTLETMCDRLYYL